ncbi:hypothetical protein [Solemya pervernicosa gill symbiont]|nr:hypothetical protein [Solemya pervernicosa gill symbiont]
MESPQQEQHSNTDNDSRVGVIAGTALGGAATAHPAGPVIGGVIGYLFGKNKNFIVDAFNKLRSGVTEENEEESEVSKTEPSMPETVKTASATSAESEAEPTPPTPVEMVNKPLPIPIVAGPPRCYGHATNITTKMEMELAAPSLQTESGVVKTSVNPRLSLRDPRCFYYMD